MVARSLFSAENQAHSQPRLRLADAYPNVAILAPRSRKLPIGGASERLLPSGRQTTWSLARQISSYRTRFDWNSEELLRQIPIA
jgi:hypothetical protein